MLRKGANSSGSWSSFQAAALTVRAAARSCGSPDTCALGNVAVPLMAVPALRPSPDPPSSYSWPHCVRTAVHRLPPVRAGTALWLWRAGRSSWGPLWLQTPGSGQVGSVVGAVGSAALQLVGQGMSRTPCAGTWEGPAQVFGREVRNGKAAISSGTGDTLGRRQVKRLSGCTPCGRQAAAPSGEPPLWFSCLGASRLCFEKVTSDSQLISVGKMFWPQIALSLASRPCVCLLSFASPSQLRSCWMPQLSLPWL